MIENVIFLKKKLTTKEQTHTNPNKNTFGITNLMSVYIKTSRSTSDALHAHESLLDT